MSVYLSFSSLNQIHNSAHEYLNKVMGVEVPENRFLTEGKVGERIITAHVSGTPNEKIKFLTCSFPVIEEVQFDDRLRFKKEINVRGTHYIIQGFADGLNPDLKTRLEIKLSSTPWSLGKFRKSMQRKMYTFLDNGEYKVDYLITGPRDPEKWDKNTLTLSRLEVDPQDPKDAEEWLMKGIERMENLADIMAERGPSTGLNEQGKCVNKFCLYGVNCRYK